MGKRWLTPIIKTLRFFFRRRTKPQGITGVGIALKVDDDLSLFGLLATDGSINRLGTGALHNTEKEMFIGITDPKPFQSLRAQITPELLKWVGGRADQNLRGKVCELQIYLMLADKTEQSIYFKYGSDSMEPPPEVSRFVTAFMEATNPWYEAQKAMVGKQR